MTFTNDLRNGFGSWLMLRFKGPPAVEKVAAESGVE
jgi:hypothetical protein